MEKGCNPEPTIEAENTAEALPLWIGDYFWQPWYAKAWWIAIVLYWLPAGTTLGPAMQSFYASGLGVAANITLMPITAGLILGFPYLRRRLGEWSPDGNWYNEDAVGNRQPGMPPPWMDELDSRSGPQWIGNRLRNSLDD